MFAFQVKESILNMLEKSGLVEHIFAVFSKLGPKIFPRLIIKTSRWMMMNFYLFFFIQQNVPCYCHSQVRTSIYVRALQKNTKNFNNKFLKFLI